MIVRRHFLIRGIVQGVGFRPFVYQLATGLQLAGWVLNDSRGVEVEVEGPRDRIDLFARRLRQEAPPLAVISDFRTTDLKPGGDAGFRILPSRQADLVEAQIAPDTFVCEDCLQELFDSGDRRFRYAFINCTNCGPRYTIIQGVPYDRPLTTMADFPMCPDCQAEYDDPASRRFHAQPNACPVCGPRLELLDGAGQPLSGDPVERAAEQLRQGRIVAVKGLGGYHLAADARSDRALEILRRRKARDEKPFALMVRDMEQVRALAFADPVEERLLTGCERPIVLLRRRPDARISPLVAPRNRYLGVMLPYTPLHYLLLESFEALVMTSANFSDEPILYRDEEALERLGEVADAFLTHNRRIHVRADDSIARVMAGKALLIRRARGFVPRPVLLPEELPPVLAVGAELKNTLCLTRRDRAFLGQHLGDLKNAEALASLEQVRAHLESVLDIHPEAVAHDLHPDYLSTRFAESLDAMPRIAVQHHHAHLVSCLAEHGRTGPAIGVIFDGIGLGDDGTVWGGEFLVGDARGYRRAAHLMPVPMPGGDAATREPWRMAVSWLQTAFEDDWPDIPLVRSMDEGEVRLLRQMMARGLNSPLTSSCGRLFDAVAALCGLRDRVSYEGQAALELEMAIDRDRVERLYPWTLSGDDPLRLDVRPLVRGVVEDVLACCAAGEIACRFHLSLARAVTDVCIRLSDRTGLKTVVLSGGVFQNRFLTEALSGCLESRGLEVLRHSLVPPNDGGLALGQAVVAGTQLKMRRESPE